MTYTIRMYRDADVDAVLLAWETASVVGHPFLSEAFLKADRKAITRVYLPNTRTWVAEKDDVVVGFISMLDDEIGAIFVQPRYHGTGAGRALMQVAKLQHDPLFVEVFERNHVGRRFYQTCGFVQVSAYEHDPTGQRMLRLRFDRAGDQSSTQSHET